MIAAEGSSRIAFKTSVQESWTAINYEYRSSVILAVYIGNDTHAYSDIAPDSN